MRDPRRPAVFVAVLFSLSVAACGGGSTAATTAPEQTASAAPAATDAPPASSEPAGGAAEPSEKLVASDGRIIVFPPGWWTKEDMGIVYVASGEDAANGLVMSGALKPGQVHVQFAKNSILSDGTTDPAAHLPDYLKMLVEGQGMTAGAPASITVAGMPAAKMTASNDKLQMLAVTVKVADDMFGDVIAYGAPGEEAALEALVMKMVEGASYPPS